jgi:hypothetical protein
MFARNERGERRVSPRLYKVLLTAHVTTSVGWLGVVFAKFVLALAAATAASPGVVAALLVSLDVLNGAFAPVASGAIVTGVLLSLGTRWGLLQHYWVVAKLALSVGVIGTAVQLAPRLVGLAAPQEPTLLGLPWAPAVLLAFAAVHLLMLGAATVLSVCKPWGKTWLGRRGAAAPLRLDPCGSVERAA